MSGVPRPARSAVTRTSRSACANGSGREHDRVDDGEDRAVRANPECQRRDRDRRESGLPYAGCAVRIECPVPSVHRLRESREGNGKNRTTALVAKTGGPREASRCSGAIARSIPGPGVRKRTARWLAADRRNRRNVHLLAAPPQIPRGMSLDLRRRFMTTTCAVQPRILIADDQPDLLDALRLLLKGEGIQMEAVTSPDAVLAAVGTRHLRPPADGPQLHRRHHLGPRRHRSAGARAGARRPAAGRRDDRLGLGRPGRRGDAARRARLRAEAVGQRAAGRHAAHRNRERPRAPSAASQLEAARARRGAPDSAQAAAGVAAADRRVRNRGVVAAGVRRRRRLLRRHRVRTDRASRCRSPTSSAKAFRRRC